MIELHDITHANFDECIKMHVAENQKGFVASNVISIAQSKVFPDTEIKAVYDRETMVGFVMFGVLLDKDRYYLFRLMVGEDHQGKGYGRAATNAVIERLRGTKGCDSVYLTCVPENTGALALYESLGFKKTGVIDHEELEMKLLFSE